jgi:hypothetical protein
MKYYKNMLVLLLTIVMSMITGCTTTTNRDKSSADNKEAAVETTDRAKEKNVLSPRMVKCSQPKDGSDSCQPRLCL